MFIGEKTETNNFLRNRKDKNGNNKVITYYRIKTIYIFECNNCQMLFDRPLANVVPQQMMPNAAHFCDKCFTHGLASSYGREIRAQQVRDSIGKKYMVKNGYITISIPLNSNYSSMQIGPNCAYIREHIKVMQDHLNRKLEANEVVHHIDGNKLNNEIDNLDLCTQQQHNNCHAKSKELIFKLYKMGIVQYNKITKMYFIKEDR